MIQQQLSIQTGKTTQPLFEHYECPIALAENNTAFYYHLVHELKPVAATLWPAQQIRKIIDDLLKVVNHDKADLISRLIGYYNDLFHTLTHSDFDQADITQ